jgi:HK97 family phage prohead protease
MSQFIGYASTTETPYDMGFYDEVVSKGAFTKTLAESPDVHFNLVHGDGGSGLPVARTGQNMTLSEDSRGLRVEAELDDDDPDVQLLQRKVNNGLISSMSFAFAIVRQRWENDNTFRRIIEASLRRGDVTVCPQGANPSASVVSMRAAGALASLRAPGRDTARQRSVLVEQLGQAAVREMRSVSLNGVRFGFGAAAVPDLSRGAAVRAQAPVVLPDHTTRARLDLARYRAGHGATGERPRR